MNNIDLKCCFFYQEGLDMSYNEEYINHIPKDKIIYFKYPAKKFVNFNFEEINLDNITLFPISGLEQVNEIKKAAEAQNLNLLLSSEDTNKVDNWLDYYKPKRQMFKVTGSELLSKKHLKYASIESEFFLKTKIKNFNSKAKIKYLNQNNTVLAQALYEHYDTDFYVSELLDIKKDELGILEYRVVVFNNIVYNISRITSSIYHKIDKKILESAEDICEKVSKTSFPNHYIMDLVVYNDQLGKEIIDVVEFNDISSSGMYLYNSIIDLSRENLLHEDITKLPFTKNDINKNQLSHNGVINSLPHRFFNKEGGFANTLKLLSNASEDNFTSDTLGETININYINDYIEKIKTI